MGPRTAYHRAMAKLRFGPARVPSRRSPKEAVSMLQRRGFTACEIDFEGGFWMDYPWATRFGELAREAKIVLSVHAPIAGFMGHLERDKKQRMAVGMLDHSAGIAKAAGAELAVVEPKAPFHIHFSDIAFATRNETKHLPYGEGTLRADPLRKALRRFKRPATVISESPDLKSTQAIFAALSASARTSSRRASSSAASSSRPRSARN